MEMEQIIKELTETSARAKSNTKRLDAVEKRQDDIEALTRAVAIVETKQDGLKVDVDEIKGDVKELKDKPAKRWDAVAASVISVLVGAVLGFVLTRLGV